MASKLLLLVFIVSSKQCLAGHDDPDGMRGLFEYLFTEPTNACNCRCGLPNREARLRGGEFTNGHEFPWLAQIQIRDEASVMGTLINSRYVLTSVSQMIGLTPYDLKVTLGQYDKCFPDVSSQNVSVEAVILHPDFSPGNRAHDLALIKVASPVKMERRIRPICLATPGMKYIGQVATVASWSGFPNLGGVVQTQCRPRKLGAPILGEKECRSTALIEEFFSSDKSCLGIIGAPSQVCSVDVGGPVMYRSYAGVYELIGVLSDGNDCLDTPSTALFTSVNEHLRWIKDMTRDACYCYKT